MLLQRDEFLFVFLHANDAFRRLFKYHHLGSLLVVGHVGNFVSQREEAQLELVPPLPLEHVMSPALIVVLRVRSPGTRAFSVMANLLKHPAAAALEPNPLDRGLLASRGWVGGVIMLVNVNVTPFEDDGALMRRARLGLSHRLSLFHRHDVDFLLVLVICLGNNGSV